METQGGSSPAPILRRFRICPIHVLAAADDTCNDLKRRIQGIFGREVSLSDGERELQPTETPDPCANLLIKLGDFYTQVRVSDEDGNIQVYMIFPGQVVGKLMDRHCSHRHLDYDSVQFLFKNMVLRPDQTLRSIPIADGDTIMVRSRAVLTADEGTMDVGRQHAEKAVQVKDVHTAMDVGYQDAEKAVQTDHVACQGAEAAKRASERRIRRVDRALQEAEHAAVVGPRRRLS